MRLSILSFKFYLSLITISFILVFILYRIVTIQIGYASPTAKTEPWFGNVARMRELLYKKNDPKKPTIFIVSGSNSLYGIDSHVLASQTNYNVNNFAIHAALHIDLLFSQIRGKVKRGDIVVAPIEWEVRDRKLGNQFDYENYLHHFSKSVNPSLPTLYEVFTSVPLDRWKDGFISYLYLPADSVSYWDFYTNESLQITWDSRKEGENYTHRALTGNGDINIAQPMSRATWIDKSVFSVPADITQNGLDQMDKWQSYFEGIGAHLIVVSPVMLEGQADEITSAETWNKIENIREKMSHSKSSLNCDPVGAIFSSLYRFDTSYHLNAEGAKLRSEDLAKCINDFISGKNIATSPIDSTATIAAVKARLSRQKENFGSGNMLFQTRLRDITNINNALAAFNNKYGTYPKSNSNKDLQALSTLSPEFIEAIPSSKDSHPYSYFSDGLTYKLLAHAPVTECTVVAAYWPQLIDETSITDNDLTLCTAYGYAPEKSPTNIASLKLIVYALEKYKSVHHSYPVSSKQGSGWDGKYSDYGTSSENWINGLTPTYIKDLPVDPRNSSSGSQQYLYRSDGSNFKLIAHGVEDCELVSQKFPSLVDPARKCWAYGFWSPPAALW